MGFNKWFPNFYVILVGPSGRCRKGAAMAPAVKLLEEANVIMTADSITRAQLVIDLQKAVSTIPHPVTQQPILHCSLSAVCTELGVFMSDWDQVFINDLIKWYDCEDKYEYKTKGEGKFKVQGVYFNMLAGTTPYVLREKLGVISLFGGLTSRMVFVNEFDRDKNIDDPGLTPEQVVIGEMLLEDMDQMLQMRGDYERTSAYKERYGTWYQSQWHVDTFQDARLHAYVERRQTHVQKLAMVMSASRSDDMVLDIQDFDRALDFLERTELKMPYTFRGVGRSELVEATDQVIQFVKTCGTITAGEILSKFYYDMSQETLEAVIKQLVEMKKVKSERDLTTRTTTLTWIGGEE